MTVSKFINGKLKILRWWPFFIIPLFAVCFALAFSFDRKAGIIALACLCAYLLFCLFWALYWKSHLTERIIYIAESFDETQLEQLDVLPIPYALIESAKMDGATEWHVFTKVCLPQCRSALYSIAILVFIDYWNMVEQPIILLPDAAQQPLSVYLSQINAGEIGLAFAMATVYMFPSLLIFLRGEEYLVDGIANQGSIKG